MTELKRLQLLSEFESPDVETRTGGQMIEAELAKEADAERAYELFLECVEQGNTKRAKSMSWYLWFKHGVDLSSD